MYGADFGDITIGRQAIAWGSARVVNPTDVIAPYAYNQLDTEDRIGVDAIRVQIPIGVLGEFDTGYVFGENLAFEKSAFFVRSQLNAVETDFSISLLGFREHLMTGFDIARGIGGAGFWLEAAYVYTNASESENEDAENYLRASIGSGLQFWRGVLRVYRIPFQRCRSGGAGGLSRQLGPTGLHRWSGLPHGQTLLRPRAHLPNHTAYLVEWCRAIKHR